MSEGRLVQDSGGIQNVHFGITKQGHLFTGSVRMGGVRCSQGMGWGGGGEGEVREERERETCH